MPTQKEIDAAQSVLNAADQPSVDAMLADVEALAEKVAAFAPVGSEGQKAKQFLKAHTDALLRELRPKPGA